MPPPGEESDLLISRVELLELLHCQLHGNERSALRAKARRLYRHVVPVEQGLLEQSLVSLPVAFRICAGGTSVEGQTDGSNRLRMLPQGQRKERRCPKARRHGVPQGRLLDSDPTLLID